jgi:hypothetical protein
MKTFLNTFEDMDWLWTTHLKPFITTRLGYQSAVIWGNEDCPTKIELYKQLDPSYKQKPKTIYVLTDDLTYKIQE